MTIPSLTIDSVREGLLSRRFSARELAEEALRFAQAENPKTNAYLHFSPERARVAAPGLPVDEADAIADPVLRGIYLASRKKAQA